MHLSPASSTALHLYDAVVHKDVSVCSRRMKAATRSDVGRSGGRGRDAGNWILDPRWPSSRKNLQTVRKQRRISIQGGETVVGSISKGFGDGAKPRRAVGPAHGKNSREGHEWLFTWYN